MVDVRDPSANRDQRARRRLGRIAFRNHLRVDRPTSSIIHARTVRAARMASFRTCHTSRDQAVSAPPPHVPVYEEERVAIRTYVAWGSDHVSLA